MALRSQAVGQPKGISGGVVPRTSHAHRALSPSKAVHRSVPTAAHRRIVTTTTCKASTVPHFGVASGLTGRSTRPLCVAAKIVRPRAAR